MARGRRWDETQDQELRWLVKNGYLIRDIAQHMGRTAASIKQRAMVLGLSLRGLETQNDTLPPACATSITDCREWLEAQVNDGLSEFQIADILGVETHRVIYAVRQLGLKSYA